MEPPVVTHLTPELPVVWHPTEVMMNMEPFKTGDAEEGLSRLQMTAKVTEESERISAWEFLVQEAWHGWEESLQTSHRMRKVRQVALWDELTWEPSIVICKLMQDEREKLDGWKEHFLGEPESFVEVEMEAHAFGMDIWDD